MATNMPSREHCRKSLFTDQLRHLFMNMETSWCRVLSADYVWRFVVTLLPLEAISCRCLAKRFNLKQYRDTARRERGRQLFAECQQTNGDSPILLSHIEQVNHDNNHWSFHIDFSMTRYDLNHGVCENSGEVDSTGHMRQCDNRSILSLDSRMHKTYAYTCTYFHTDYKVCRHHATILGWPEEMGLTETQILNKKIQQKLTRARSSVRSSFNNSPATFTTNARCSMHMSLCLK